MANGANHPSIIYVAGPPTAAHYSAARDDYFSFFRRVYALYCNIQI